MRCFDVGPKTPWWRLIRRFREWRAHRALRKFKSFKMPLIKNPEHGFSIDEIVERGVRFAQPDVDSSTKIRTEQIPWHKMREFNKEKK